MENPEHIEKNQKTKSPKKDFKKQFEEHEKKIDWALQAFNIDDFQVDPKKMLSVVIPGLGKVEYMELTTEETHEFQGMTDPFDLGLHVLYKMLSKANSAITFEKVKNLDPVASGALMKHIRADRRFLSPQPQKS